MNGWISVKDRLPEESGYVLVHCSEPKGYIRGVQYSAKNKAFNASDDSNAESAFTDVTHWMPLPEPPENEKEESE